MKQILHENGTGIRTHDFKLSCYIVSAILATPNCIDDIVLPFDTMSFYNLRIQQKGKREPSKSNAFCDLSFTQAIVWV